MGIIGIFDYTVCYRLKREIWYEQDYMKAEFHGKNNTIYSTYSDYKYNI